MSVYFFDSYAIIEIINNNEAYAKFSSEGTVTFQFNLIEVFNFAYKNVGEEMAKKIYFKLKPSVVEIPDEIVFEAMKFKSENSKKNLSYIDCLGYVYAKHKKIKFLTGDIAFKNMKNVEFVK